MYYNNHPFFQKKLFSSDFLWLLLLFGYVSRVEDGLHLPHFHSGRTIRSLISSCCLDTFVYYQVQLHPGLSRMHTVGIFFDIFLRAGHFLESHVNNGQLLLPS
jgi:hypothetical protein